MIDETATKSKQDYEAKKAANEVSLVGAGGKLERPQFVKIMRDMCQGLFCFTGTESAEMLSLKQLIILRDHDFESREREIDYEGPDGLDMQIEGLDLEKDGNAALGNMAVEAFEMLLSKNELETLEDDPMHVLSLCQFLCKKLGIQPDTDTWTMGAYQLFGKQTTDDDDFCSRWVGLGTAEPKAGIQFENEDLKQVLGDPSRVFRCTDDGRALGLKWEEVGSKPKEGNKIVNPKLASGLQERQEFSSKQWDEFNVSDLPFDAYIEAGGKYFKPAGWTKFNIVKSVQLTVPNLQI